MQHKVVVLLKKLCDDAIVPVYKTDGAAGADVSCIEDVFLLPGEAKLVKTGLAIEVPRGYEAQVRPRSSLALAGMTVMNSPGTIDSDYRGELCVILINHTGTEKVLYKNTRIAQLVFAQVTHATICVVDELSDTARGAGGFGSTGR
jgi:dUTP pyrophosphatase